MLNGRISSVCCVAGPVSLVNVLIQYVSELATRALHTEFFVHSNNGYGEILTEYLDLINSWSLSILVGHQNARVAKW